MLYVRRRPVRSGSERASVSNAHAVGVGVRAAPRAPLSGVVSHGNPHLAGAVMGGRGGEPRRRGGEVPTEVPAEYLRCGDAVRVLREPAASTDPARLDPLGRSPKEVLDGRAAGGRHPFPPPSPASCCYDDPHGAWTVAGAPSTATRPRTSCGCNQTGVVTNTNRTPSSAPAERHQGDATTSDEFIKLHSNKAGTCFGDSGGPNVLGGTNIALARCDLIDARPVDRPDTPAGPREQRRTSTAGDLAGRSGRQILRLVLRPVTVAAIMTRIAATMMLMIQRIQSMPFVASTPSAAAT